MKTKDIITIDIETTGLNWDEHRITCICAKVKSDEQQVTPLKYASNYEDKILETFISWISTVDLDNSIILTKNGNKFDIPFIYNRLEKHSMACTTFDMIARVDLNDFMEGHVRLADMATLMNIPGKTGDGLKAIQLFEEGKLDELKDYCYNDVMITELVYLKLRSYGKYTRKR